MKFHYFQVSFTDFTLYFCSALAILSSSFIFFFVFYSASPTTTEELTEGSSQKPAKTAARLSNAEEINNLDMDFEPAQTDRISFYLSYSTITIAFIACVVLTAATVAFSILLWHFKANRKGQKPVEEPKIDLHL